MNEIKDCFVSERIETICPIEDKPKEKNLTTLQGTLTKRIELRENYYYSFIKLKDKLVELPVIFKEKPNLAQYSQLELTGYYSNSETNIRKSFTCLTYVILGVAYYLLTQPIKQENKPIKSQSTQTYFSPEIGKQENTTQEEALLEELINQIKELNQIL